jgi:hypothetical protein
LGRPISERESSTFAGLFRQIGQSRLKPGPDALFTLLH